MKNNFIFKDKRLGLIVEDGDKKILVCHRYPNHIYRLNNSLGMAEGAINELAAKGITEIRFIYHGRECESVYIASPEFMLRYGTPIEYDKYEKQFHLPLDKFERVVR